jgi:hypothetical protein
MNTIKFKHLMIDIETLGSVADAVILSIGAVPFDIKTGETGKEFVAYPDVNSQFDTRKVQWNSLSWWMVQNDKARFELTEAERSFGLKACLFNLREFCSVNLDDNFKVWSHGASFDIPILNHAYSEIADGIVPWKYRNQLDTRTMLYCSKISTKQYDNEEGTKHSAISDCHWQIKWLVDAYRILCESPS